MIIFFFQTEFNLHPYDKVVKTLTLDNLCQQLIL